MKINAIAAIGDQNQIALNNELPWHYPEDLKIFKEKVKGKTVIMGRKTYESMPESFVKTITPIVVTSAIDDYELAALSLEDAIDLASDLDESEIWICGGVSIYKEAIEKKLIDSLHISHIPYEGPADRYFPSFISNIQGVSHGETIHSPSNDKSFRYKVYQMEKKARQAGELLDFTGSFLRPIVRTGLARVEFPNTRYVNDTVITATSSDISFNPLTGLQSTNIQDALNELSLALSWHDSNSELNTVGQIRYNHSSGMIETMTANGIVTVGDIDNNVRMNQSASSVLQDIIQGELNRYTDSAMPASELTGIGSTLRDRINTTIKEYDRDSDVFIDIRQTMTTPHAAIHVLGSSVPMEYQTSENLHTLDIRLSGFFLGQFLNNINFEINF